MKDKILHKIAKNGLRGVIVRKGVGVSDWPVNCARSEASDANPGVRFGGLAGRGGRKRFSKSRRCIN
jgi:hypothetical protein